MYDYIEIAEKIQLDQLVVHSKLLFESFFYELLVTGNFTLDDSIEISKKIDHFLSPVPPVNLITKRVVKLRRQNYLYQHDAINPNQTNNSITNIFQIGYLFYFIHFYFYLFFYFYFIFLFLFLFIFYFNKDLREIVRVLLYCIFSPELFKQVFTIN